MAIGEFDYRFKPRSELMFNHIDRDIEDKIDAAGRDKVFAEARRLGWASEDPPKWVWLAILSSLANPNQSKAIT